MYTLAVKRNLIAQHFLFGGDWGPENELHSHHYKIEVQLQGKKLDQHGYLVDIVEVEARLENLSIIIGTRRSISPEFKGLTPASSILPVYSASNYDNNCRLPNLTAMQVRIWENEIAWTAYRQEL